MTAEAAVEAYKNLSQVERAFRSAKTDLDVRPLHHHTEPRVRAHVFLCMLAYYVEWHLRRSLAPLLFQDHDRAAAAEERASVVAKAEISPAARQKKARRANRGRAAGAQLPHPPGRRSPPRPGPGSASASTPSTSSLS